MPAEGRITSGFGPRKIRIGSSNHKGVDISPPVRGQGQPIYAANGGVVILARYSTSFGNYIKIEHSNGDITLYAHCSKLLVRVGDTVDRGQQIAKMGMTGTATGVHLHFELIRDGVQIDPVPYLPAS
jgi:murein DD-endopeptidase MepM/ murein hydrolase activator NlpD